MKVDVKCFGCDILHQDFKLMKNVIQIVIYIYIYIQVKIVYIERQQY